jgi:hypothetical protein
MPTMRRLQLLEFYPIMQRDRLVHRLIHPSRRFAGWRDGYGLGDAEAHRATVYHYK